MYYDIEGDEMGAEEILLGGYYYPQIMGAARRAPVARRASPARSPQAQAIAAKRVQDGVLVSTNPPDRAQELVMGIDSVNNVAAAGVVAINAQPQQVFRPERLVVNDPIAASFLINDIRIGIKSQFLNATPVPAAGFAAGAVGVRMKMDTAQINSTITVSVTNVSAAALRFNAMLVGVTIS